MAVERRRLAVHPRPADDGLSWREDDGSLSSRGSGGSLLREDEGSLSSRRLGRGRGVGRDGGVHVPDIQRSRLLAAAVASVEELGYTGTTVAHITERARVSRRTFYELFENCEDCLAAVLEGAIEQVAAEIAAAGLSGLSWRERVRGGLWVVLSFFDRQPALARVCVVQSQHAGPVVLERRQRVLDQLAAIVDEGRLEGSEKHRPVGLTAQGVVGGVAAILYLRLREPDGSLRDLLGELMAIIVLPYLGSTVARRERSRPAPGPVSLSSGGGERLTAILGSVDSLAAVGMRLTHRTACVLQDLAEHPGSSNREISDRAGVHDQGQMSKLLARLQRFGLLINGANGAPIRGEANRWELTPTGAQVTRSISAHTNNGVREQVAS